MSSKLQIDLLSFQGLQSFTGPIGPAIGIWYLLFKKYIIQSITKYIYENILYIIKTITSNITQ